MRPSWDTTWMSVAQQVAQRSLCVRAQVGAVIVTADNRVIATGYNGPPAGFRGGGFGGTITVRVDKPPAFEPDRCDKWCERGGSHHITVDYSDCPSLHAEANALIAADRSTWQGGTIYVTGSVCFTCAKLIANSGLKRVVWQEETVDRSYRRPAASVEFLRSCGIVVESVQTMTKDDG